MKIDYKEFMDNYYKVKDICKGKYNNLSISTDLGGEDNDPVLVFLFTPNTDKHDHYHIEMEDKEIKDLYEFIREYLGK